MNRHLIEQLLVKELSNNEHTRLGDLVQTLVSKCIHQTEFDQGEALAASFDLMVGLFYYEKIVSNGWLKCPNGDEHYFFPYVNVCPRCALEERFVHHKAGKTASANIGKSAITALVLFVREWFSQTGSDLEICKASEPIDLIVYDRENDVAFLAEVKSAPLFTLPLAIKTDVGATTATRHESITLCAMRGARMGLLLPVPDGAGGWESEMIYFAREYDGTASYFLEMLTLLVNNDVFYIKFVTTWVRAFNAYESKDKEDSIFWLTGGCGAPSPTPAGWPLTRGTKPKAESISDGKTSVGMDRTDDIKKGVYQLLKLRMIDAVAEGMTVKVGILSNAHAARHHDDYVLPIQDVMWLKTDQTEVETIDDLPAGTPLFNLYDGIITFTKSFTRDGWLQQIFDFNGIDRDN